MKIARVIMALAVVALAGTLSGLEAHAQTAAPVEARNVVLVHGAWADGSSWAEVIPLLQAAGLKVTAVQNPLTSLQDSVAATRRELALQDGPTVLVAHSWAGTVISEVGTDPKVTALVYVAARDPRGMRNADQRAAAHASGVAQSTTSCGNPATAAEASRHSSRPARSPISWRTRRLSRSRRSAAGASPSRMASSPRAVARVRARV